MRRIEALVEGRVQGVNFRRYVKGVAERNDIKGRVKNLADGNVELIAEGDEAKLRIMIEEIKGADLPIQVEDISLTWSDSEGEFSSFTISR